MGKSIKINFIFNLINTVTSLLFPLITFPYVSRILLPEGIGIVNFYQSIIQYIVLFSSLGIPMYAIRETAKYRDDRRRCSITTLEILSLHFILTFIGYLVVFILCCTVSEVKENIPLFLILSAQLFFTVIGCEWFYQGVEDFKYITIRSIIVRTLSVVFLFIFVKSREDIILYGIYCVAGIYAGNIFNFLRLRKYLDFSVLKELKPLKHLKPALKIFVLNLIISLYVNLNSIMLGFLKGPESVGFFTSATKITQILLGVTSALGTVMLPRLSNLIANKNYEEFNRLANLATKFMFAVTLPLSVAVILLADNLILLLSGDAYADAILTLQILSFIIFAIGLSGVLGIQILYPQGKESIVIKSTAVGAVINLLLNFILIPRFSHHGAAVATLLAEIGVTATMVFIGKGFVPVKWRDKEFMNYFTGSILMGSGVFMVSYLEMNIIYELIISFIVGSMIYAIYLKLTNDSIFSMTVGRLINRINHKG